MQKVKEQLQEAKHEMELWLWMSSDDYCETCIMIVFWCWLPDHHWLPDHRMMFATCWWTGGLVVWTLWWWVAMRCHLIMPIWFSLFQINSSILTIRNSYALQWRSLRIAVNDWHWALTDELVCTSPLNVRVDHCESQCLALFTLGRRHVPSRKVEAALCVKDVGHGTRGNCDFISTMGNSG